MQKVMKWRLFVLQFRFEIKFFLQKNILKMEFDGKMEKGQKKMEIYGVFILRRVQGGAEGLSRILGYD